MGAKIQNKNISEVYQSVFFSLMLDKRSKSNNGSIPVAVRVTYQRQRLYLRTGLSLQESEFDRMMVSSKGSFYELRQEQLKFFGKVVATAKVFIDNGSFSLSSLKNKLKDRSSSTINELIENKIGELKERGSAKTAKLYSDSLKKFESIYGGDVPFSKMTSDMMMDFKKKMEHQKLSQTTISIYLRCFRSICNLAIYKGLMNPERYPFRRKGFETDKVKIPHGSKRKDWYLNVDDILKLWSYNDDPSHRDTSYGKVVCEALNLWMFSYLGNGMNLSDMARLTFSDHYFKTNGKELSFKRKKTESTLSNELVIYVPVIPALKKILDDYGEKPANGKLVFPFILNGSKNEERNYKTISQWNKNIRDRLKKVCVAVGIEDHVTMTWARHSYQTNLAHKKVPESYIDQAVGHADSSVTDGYIGLYSTEDRFRYNSLLLEPDKEA